MRHTISEKFIDNLLKRRYNSNNEEAGRHLAGDSRNGKRHKSVWV
jgi:hypothetical protein